MERRIQELRARQRAHPRDPRVAGDLALELRRAGDRVGAAAVLGALRDGVEDPEVESLWRELVGEGRWARRVRVRTLHRAERPIEAVAMSPDGTRVAFSEARWDRAVGDFAVATRVVGVDDGSLRTVTAGQWRARALAFSPDGRLLATGGVGARVWDVETGSRRAALGADRIQAFRVGIRRRALVVVGRASARSWLTVSRLEQRIGGRAREHSEALFEDLLLAGIQEERARRAVFEQIMDLLEEEGFRAARGWLLPLMQGERGAWESRPRPEEGTAFLIRDDAACSAVALATQGRLTVLDLQGDRLWTAESGQVRYLASAMNRGPEARPWDVAPAGRAVAIGSLFDGEHRDPYRSSLRRGLVLLRREAPESPEVLLADRAVSAVAFCPSGGALVAGTPEGEVLLLSLVEGDAAAPRLRPAPGAPGGDTLRDAEGRGERFVRLRSFPGGSLRFRGPRVVLRREVAWILPREGGEVRRLECILEPGAPPAWLSITLRARRVELSGDGDALLGQDEAGRWLRVERPAGALGRLHRLLPVEARPAVPSRPARRARRSRLPARAAIEEVLGCKMSRAALAGPSGLAAVRAVRRDRELWVLRLDDPSQRVHRVFEAPLRDLVWDPSGLRLLVLLRDGTLEVHGFGEPEAPADPPGGAAPAGGGPGDWTEEVAPAGEAPSEIPALPDHRPLLARFVDWLRRLSGDEGDPG